MECFFQVDICFGFNFRIYFSNCFFIKYIVLATDFQAIQNVLFINQTVVAWLDRNIKNDWKFLLIGVRVIVLNATTWSYAIQPILWKNHTHPSIQPTNQCSIEQMHPNSLQRSFGHINHIIYGNYLWMRDNFPECLTTTTTGLCLPEEYIELPSNGVFGIQEASFIGKTVFLSKTVLLRKKQFF